MRFLVSNDDGIFAPGLRALVTALVKSGEVFVAAPDHNCSANSHHLTMHDRIPVRETTVPGAARAWAVGGTPADCVHLALSALLTEKVDLVVSGINRGPNLATDCLYSGTVAAALDGWMLGLPGLAVSLCSYAEDADYAFAARIAVQMADYVQASGKNMVLNVNVPALAPEQICGVRLCGIDRRILYRNDCYVAAPGEDAAQTVWQFVPSDCMTDQPSADHAAIMEGFVSVTPLTAYWSDAKLLRELAPDFADGAFSLPE